MNGHMYSPFLFKLDICFVENVCTFVLLLPLPFYYLCQEVVFFIAYAFACACHHFMSLNA